LAAKKNLKKLEALRGEGYDPRAVIDQSIANGWTGLFELRGNKSNGHGKKSPAPIAEMDDFEKARKQARAEGRIQ
jgi:hypothetical protein